MRFAGRVTEDDGTSYLVENAPQDVVLWEAQRAANNVEALKKYTSIMQILHVAAFRQGLTTHKGWTDWLAHVASFDMAEASEVDPTEAPASEGPSSPSLSALG